MIRWSWAAKPGMPTGATATKPETRSGSSVTIGSEYRPLIDGETITGRSTFSRSSRTRSQVRGEPCDGDDWPKPGRSTAIARYPACASASSVPISSQVADEKLAPWSRTTGRPSLVPRDAVMDLAAFDLNLVHSGQWSVVSAVSRKRHAGRPRGELRREDNSAALEYTLVDQDH